ncbi:hypothetical protein JMUB3936_0364 [Leptotrichia wadei]|jgi:hypothetical protein|uniref:Uncharacterized protein n=1 Tax=Leptotrichia wadei TaxID=157687 RepID=A0A510KQY4_9FUSO|nr:hypothetical protein [Leptotrichia wadei]BBM54086.1 hypothetical protein JMUB3936_0364 [Leptotrichia wadei]
MEEFRVYLYDKNGNLIGIYLAPSQEEFETDKLKYCSEYVEGETYISYIEINNAIIDNGVIREMKTSEKINAGFITLLDGQYLENEEIKTIEKPNKYSNWDKNINTWVEDKAEKLKYLKELRYQKQQEFVKYKKELEEKEEEKTEFENLGFDITETEEMITEIKSEMDLLKTEIAKLTKDIKKVEKEVA